MDVLPRRLSLPLKVLTTSARALLWLVLLAWLVFGAAWAGLHWVIVPRIGELRPQLESRASQALGVPVRIGAVAAHSDSLFPSIELGDVRLYDREGRVALQLPRVLATLSPRSLWNLGFEQLVIEQPELDVRRSADGRISVAGIEIAQNQESDGSAADWVFTQTEWVIAGGSVRWSDELRGAPPLVLQQLDLRLHNGARSHEFRLDATPPPELGSRFSVRGQFRQPLLSGRAGAVERWHGQLYAMFERVDVVQLLRHVPLRLDVAGGSGALRVWATVDEGRIVDATADVSLSGVGVRLAAELPSLDLSALGGRFGGRSLEGGFEVYTQGLRFDTVDGLHWPGGDVRVSHVAGATPADTRNEIRANGLNLETLAQLAKRLPLERRVHQALALYAPRGQIEQLQARVYGPWEAPERFDARGRLRKLEVASRPHLDPLQADEDPPSPLGSPGVSGLTVDFDLTQAGGRASVVMQQGHVELPGLFDQPRITLDQLTAEVQWKQQQDGQFSLQIANARMANADAQGEFQLKWNTGDAASGGRLPGVLDLQGSLGRADVVAVYRYLPRVIHPDVRTYLQQALPKGRAGGVRFRVKGDLRDFPFSQPGQGEFRITANVQDTLFIYVPPSVQPAGQARWPALTDVHGELVIDHASLQLRNINARLDGAPQVRITQGDARIPDMGHEARVVASLQLAGPLEGMVHGFVSNSPLDPMLGGVLTQAHATGTSDVQLKLDLPLMNLEKSVVQGQVRLSGNELQFAPQLPRISRLRGVVHFNEQGFALSGVQGRLLGGDVRAEGGTIHAPGTTGEVSPKLRVQGTLTAQGVRQESQLGVVARLAQQATGSTAYTAEFGMRQGVPELQVSSSLQGLALNLPAPLTKTAEAALPLRLQTALMAGEADGVPRAGPLQDVLRFDLGRIMALRYVRDVTGPQAQVLRGTVGVGLPAGDSVPMPDSGVVASIGFDELDVDAWRTLAAAPAAVSGLAARNATPVSLLRDYLPTSLMVRGNRMVAGGQHFTQLVAGGTREGQVWRANVDARELSGYLEYRMPTSVGAGSVHARLARLVLAQDNARGVETMLDQQPVSIPALDVVVESLELRGKNLGRVEIEAINRGLARRDEGAREWRLNKLNITMPEAVLTASGNWAIYQEASEPVGRLAARPPAGAVRTERRRTAMNFRIDIADAGGLLTRLGMPGLIRAGKGRMEGQASWIGSPMGLDYPTLGGSFNVNVETGQFLKADPGIAKLMGVLSLQSLPRRLTLDFRDVFSEGFAFDYVRGDIQVDQGIAMTSNLQMKGVNAAVLMEGHADLAKETQELRVVVVPEINAGTASLIASWINPAVGLGSFLAQIFLRGPVIAAATQEFRISGSWSDPQMTKVEKTPPAQTGNAGSP